MKEWLTGEVPQVWDVLCYFKIFNSRLGFEPITTSAIALQDMWGEAVKLIPMGIVVCINTKF